MSPDTLSKSEAKKLAINGQLLDGRTKITKTKNGVLKIIEHLGYVQIDTISVIERAHHHTLWVRQPEYKPEYLYALLEKDRKIFEYYSHALSYLPIEDYRFYLNRRSFMSDPIGKWEKDRINKYGHLMKPVLERIRNEGPLGSKDFEATAPGQGNDWTGHPKPNKAALDLLFWCGEIMISRRENNHRIFDLTERVLPSNVDTTVPDNSELGCFLVRRAIASYGIATKNEIVDHIRGAKREIIIEALNNLIESGEVIEVTINGLDNIKYYTFAGLSNRIGKLKGNNNPIHFLSPFDNLLIQRDRIKRLFDFDYTIECYLPATKRKYGYYVLPILYGDKLIGRFDPKTDRKKNILQMNSIHFENGFKPDDRFWLTFADKINDLKIANGCDTIEIEQVYPAKYKAVIKRFLKS